MNILIPLAGKDERYETQGIIKPLMKVCGVPLIKYVTEKLPLKCDKAIFVCLREHEEKYKLATKLKQLFGLNINIIMTETQTEGSLCSALLAEKIINNKEDLAIFLGDVYIETQTLATNQPDISGIIPVEYKKMDKKWGYVDLNKDGYVVRLNEKESNPDNCSATMGLYYFNHGKDFVWAGKQVVQENIRIPPYNLFYIGSVYNKLIERGDKIAVSDAKIKAVFDSPESITVYNNLMKI